jgi:hypothetical protein
MYQANRLAQSPVLRLVVRSDCSNSLFTGKLKVERRTISAESMENYSDHTG